MKKKFSRILGIGLSFMLIASLMVFAIPASASSLSWGSESNIPKDVDFFLAPAGTSILDLAVNDDVIYAATGTTYTLAGSTIDVTSIDTSAMTPEDAFNAEPETLVVDPVAFDAQSGPVTIEGEISELTLGPGWPNVAYLEIGVRPEATKGERNAGVYFIIFGCVTDLLSADISDYTGQKDPVENKVNFIELSASFSYKITLNPNTDTGIGGTADLQVWNAAGDKEVDIQDFPYGHASTWEEEVQGDLNEDYSEAHLFYSIIADRRGTEGVTYNATVGDITIDGVPEGSILYKSTDAGRTWISLATSTDYPTTKTIEHVAVARDDADQVVASMSDNTIYYSSNGGSSWSGMKKHGNCKDVCDIDIAPGSSRYVAVAGQNNANGADLFTLYLGLAGSWYARSTETGFDTTHTKAHAVAFSPNFPTDKIITVVTSKDAAASFQVFRYETGETKWNSEISFFASDWGTDATGGVAVGSLADGAITGALVAASISLPETYLGTDEQERIVFIGLAAGDGTADSGSGVVRLSDTYRKVFTTWSAGNEGKINSVAYSESGKLLAGDYDASQVFYTTDPMASTPRFLRINSLKQPGGVGKVTVAWSGDTAVAASQGDESAFAVSNDDGYSWNDISLIDTELDVMDDVAVSADGGIVYLTTHSGNDVSVWRKASSWTRVFSSRDQSDASYLVRLAPEDADAVYISAKGTKDVWVSKDGGLNKWKAARCYRLTSVQDFVVESADVVYAIDAAECTKTINAGQSWGSAKSLNGLINAQTISLAPNGDVLVGGMGKVSFSKDGGSSFTKITDQPSATEPVHIVADPDYAENGIIYIAAGNEFERGTTDKTMSWSGREPTDALGHTAKGIAEYEGIIYVLTHKGTDSYLWRALNLKTGANAALCLWSYFKTDYDLDFTPTALKMSSGPKFWAIDGKALVSITDPIATLAPTLVAPADGFGVEVNPGSGEAYNVTFIWERYSDTDIKEMDMQIATDSAFEGIVYEETFINIDSDTIAKVIGPAGPSGQIAQFNPGDTYYWRVRVSEDAPSYSPWSEVRSFRVESPIKFGLVSPTMGAIGIGTMPTFVWDEYEGAIGYEIMVAEDPTFAVPDWIRTSSATFFKSEDALAYSTTYYWKVRGVTGEAAPKKAAPGGPWVSGVFTTEAKPVEAAPPITIEPTPPTKVDIIEVPVTQTIPQAIPSFLLWTIIGIGAVLFIALIVLIVRTRRVA